MPCVPAATYHNTTLHETHNNNFIIIIIIIIIEVYTESKVHAVIYAFSVLASQQV